MVDTQANPSTCWWWRKNTGEDRAQASIVSGPTIPVPVGHTNDVVKLVKADTSGGQADQVFFGGDPADFVVSTGNGMNASTTEALWWVSESGVRFGIAREAQTLHALGLGIPPAPAPWSVLRLLAPGPMLSKSDALVRHDALPVDVHPGVLEATQ